jgi:hypothetical protein
VCSEFGRFAVDRYSRGGSPSAPLPAQTKPEGVVAAKLTDTYCHGMGLFSCGDVPWPAVDVHANLGPAIVASWVNR